MMTDGWRIVCEFALLLRERFGVGVVGERRMLQLSKLLLLCNVEGENLRWMPPEPEPFDWLQE